MVHCLIPLRYHQSRSSEWPQPIKEKIRWSLQVENHYCCCVDLHCFRKSWSTANKFTRSSSLAILHSVRAPLSRWDRLFMENRRAAIKSRDERLVCVPWVWFSLTFLHSVSPSLRCWEMWSLDTWGRSLFVLALQFCSLCVLTKNNYLAFLHSVSGTQKMVCCYRWQTPETSAHSQNVWFSLAIRRTVCLSSRGFMATWGALLTWLEKLAFYSPNALCSCSVFYLFPFASSKILSPGTIICDSCVPLIPHWVSYGFKRR